MKKEKRKIGVASNKHHNDRKKDNNQADSSAICEKGSGSSSRLCLV